MHKILAVDDEKDALKILRLHLEGAGYNVLLATDGEEALEMVEKHPDIDCILLDRMMPKMDGMEVLRRLKALDSPHRHIPVILQTAKKEEWEIYEGINAKAIHYITKPFMCEALLSAVESILKETDAIREAMREE